jgi:hypothetical protein
VRHLDELRPYQQRIATHLYDHDAALCVLRPGGGKNDCSADRDRWMLDQVSDADHCPQTRLGSCGRMR